MRIVNRVLFWYVAMSLYLNCETHLSFLKKSFCSVQKDQILVCILVELWIICSHVFFQLQEMQHFYKV